MSERNKKTSLELLLGGAVLTLVLLHILPTDFMDYGIQLFLTFLPFIVILFISIKTHLNYKKYLVTSRDFPHIAGRREQMRKDALQQIPS